jgi:hypothetical protein
VGRFAVVFFRPVTDLEFAAEVGGVEGADLGAECAPGPAVPLVVAGLFEVAAFALPLTGPFLAEALFLGAVEALFLDGDAEGAVTLELLVF